MTTNPDPDHILFRYGYQILTIIFGVLLFTYCQTQDPITFNNGEGFDGVKYVNTVEQLRAGTEISGPAPFVYRLATPYLVSLLPFNILYSYFIFNSFFALISGLLLFYWLKRTLKNAWISFGFVLFLFFHWQASLRFTVFYPADCDPLAITFIILGLIILRSSNTDFKWKNVILLAFLTFLGAFQREFILCLAFGILLLGNCFCYKDNQITINKNLLIRNCKAFTPVFLAGIVGIYITHRLVVTEEAGYGFLHAVYRWMHQKSVFQLAAGFYYTLGILFILPFLFRKSALSVLKSEMYLLPIFAIALILSWISGGDTERFILWFCPIYFLIIGKVLVKNQTYFLRKRIYIPLVISLTLTLRVFWEIPQFYIDYEGVSYPFFAVFGEDNFVNILSTHAKKWVTTVNLILYLLLSLYFVYWRFEKRILGLVKWD